MIEAELQSAYRVLHDSIIYYQGKPVGTMAACDPEGVAAENYQDCFVRDFAASAMVFLADGEYDTVRNFLVTVLDLHSQRKADAGHELVSGVMPARYACRYRGCIAMRPWRASWQKTLLPWQGP